VLCAHCLPAACKTLLQSHVLLCTKVPGLLEPCFHIFANFVAAPLCLDVPTCLLSLHLVLQTLHVQLYVVLSEAYHNTDLSKLLTCATVQNSTLRGHVARQWCCYAIAVQTFQTDSEHVDSATPCRSCVLLCIRALRTTMYILNHAL
jgi:hypothetical protein